MSKTVPDSPWAASLAETVAQALHFNYLCDCKQGEQHVTTASDLLDARTAIRVIKEANGE